MPRMPRVEFPGAVYHVIHRGNNKERIFHESIDKGYFLKLLRTYKENMDFELFGYVLMDNHYHLLVRTWERPLQDIMHRLNSTYSKYFNWKYERTGHVFQGRYKGILVLSDAYLFAVLRYIHQNPVRAGICDSVEDYQWSSDAYYRGVKKGFVDVDFILGMINDSRKTAVNEYRLLVEELEKEDYEKPSAIGKASIRLGNDGIEISARKTLDEILHEVVPDETVYLLIKSGSRCRYLTPYKMAFIEKGLAEGYSKTEVGRCIGIGPSSINGFIKRSI